MKHKTRRTATLWLTALLITVFVLSGCSHPAQQSGSPDSSAAADDQTNIEVEIMDFSNETQNVIYLAGGCFWGLEHLMQSIPGVIDAQSGYANGTGAEDANYSAVCSGKTGFRETVRVEYDPAGTVKIRTAKSVINIEFRIAEALALGIIREDLSLILNTI